MPCCRLSRKRPYHQISEDLSGASEAQLVPRISNLSSSEGAEIIE